MGQKVWSIQLHSHIDREVIQDSGGVVYVAEAGGTAKVDILDADGAAASNPVSITNGLIAFRTADTVDSVDLYGIAPGGQPFRYKGVDASGLNEIYIDTNALQGVLVIPFDIADTTATTETDTGFDLPVGALVLPSAAVKTDTLDATETIDVGILSTEGSGDADGFLDGASVGTAVTVVGTLTQGSATLGVLLSVQDSANAGDLVPEAHMVVSGSTSVTYTLSAGTDTAAGFISLPLQLPPG